MRKTLKERFETKFRKGLPEECWEWLASKNVGYGQIGAGGKYGKPLFAHRVSYELYKGPIPAGKVIDHLCRNSGCVNPAHLEAVTQGENILRGMSFAGVKAREDACPNGHAYTDDNVYGYRGHRLCRACRTQAEARRQERRAA